MHIHKSTGIRLLNQGEEGREMKGRGKIGVREVSIGRNVGGRGGWEKNKSNGIQIRSKTYKNYYIIHLV